MLEFAHPNLVRLIGVAVQQRPWLCVLEYMEVPAASTLSFTFSPSLSFSLAAALLAQDVPQFGDLRSVMRAAKDKDITLSFLEQLKFCVQIATGIRMHM